MRADRKHRAGTPTERHSHMQREMALGPDDDQPNACPRGCGGDIADPCAPECYLDHKGNCVGCQLGGPCPPTCPIRSGEITAPVIMRFAALLLVQHPMGSGYDIGAAVFAAGQMLADERRPYPLNESAIKALTDYLIRQHGPDCGLTGTQLLGRAGLLMPLEENALTLYAAAADLAGTTVNPEDFGDFR